MKPTDILAFWILISLLIDTACGDTKTKIRLCGNILSNTLSLVCQGRYNGPTHSRTNSISKRAVRHTGVARLCCQSGCSYEDLRMFCSPEVEIDESVFLRAMGFLSDPPASSTKTTTVRSNAIVKDQRRRTSNQLSTNQVRKSKNGHRLRVRKRRKCRCHKREIKVSNPTSYPPPYLGTRKPLDFNRINTLEEYYLHDFPKDYYRYKMKQWN